MPMPSVFQLHRYRNIRSCRKRIFCPNIYPPLRERFCIKTMLPAFEINDYFYVARSWYSSGLNAAGEKNYLLIHTGNPR